MDIELKSIRGRIPTRENYSERELDSERELGHIRNALAGGKGGRYGFRDPGPARLTKLLLLRGMLEDRHIYRLVWQEDDVSVSKCPATRVAVLGIHHNLENDVLRYGAIKRKW